MAELMQDQVARAGKAVHDSLRENVFGADGVPPWEKLSGGDAERYVRIAKHVAPFLQLPWDEMTKEEFRSINCEFATTSFHIVQEFIRRRNAALIPKPVDPRKKAIEAILRARYTAEDVLIPSIANEIIQSLDGAK